MTWRPVLVVEEAGVPGENHDHGQATGKLYHLRLRVECTFFRNLQSRARTHAILVIETPRPFQFQPEENRNVYIKVLKEPMAKGPDTVQQVIFSCFERIRVISPQFLFCFRFFHGSFKILRESNVIIIGIFLLIFLYL